MRIHSAAIRRKMRETLMLSRQNGVRAWMMRLPLARKLLLLNLIGVAAVLICTQTIFLLIYSTVEFREISQLARSDAALYANAIAPMLVFGDRQQAEITLQTAVNNRAVQSVIVRDQHGRVFVSWHAPELDRLQVRLLEEKHQMDWLDSWRFPSLGSTHDVMLENEMLGTVEVSLSLRELRHTLSEFFFIGVVLTLCAMAAAPFLLNRLQARALRSIFELSAVAESVAKNRDYSMRARIRSQDEVSRLAFHFNEMLARIETWEKDLRDELQQTRESERQLDQLANQDSLTNLPNRHYFHRRLEFQVEQCLLMGQTLALIFIDLDNFKFVNDNFGHDAGDMVLIVVAKRLTGMLRTSDALCRLGGDEFAGILGSVADLAAAEALADRLVACIREPIMIEGRRMPIGVSIGIACAPQHATDAKTLLHKADLAMYRAKRAGKNQYAVYSGEGL